jgi:HAD superfamily hydrolase (TIGR01458 family)
MKIKGILSDLDGTLYFRGKAIDGAIETVNLLRKKGIKLLFFTNTDSKSPDTVLRYLHELGFSITQEELYTPIIALKQFLRKNTDKSIFLVTSKEVEKEFLEFNISKDSPDYVIIADFRDNWDVNRLNEAFKYILKGAKLLGTQGNRYFLDRKANPVIDTGSFINMLSYAANIEPVIFGKPSVDYFCQALEKLKLSSNEVIVIGDDIETDIQGALNVGLKGILVKTGKGAFEKSSKIKIEPYKIIESFNLVIKVIDNLEKMN